MSPSSLSFNRHVSKGEFAVKARLTCGDPDDQKFIDLAVAGKALLLSQDRHILLMLKKAVYARYTFARSYLSNSIQMIHRPSAACLARQGLATR